LTRDQIIGVLMAIGSIVGIALYAWLVFLSEWAMLILKITAFIAVGAVLGIMAWIGYTLATTPPPPKLEEIEKEIEKELKELEKEVEKEAKKEEAKEEKQGGG